jgi:alpha-L-fucosidase 2
VPGEDPEVVYNCPNGVMTVFPGEHHGLHSPPEAYRVALASYRNHRNEGGNDLVLYNLAGARLGALDLERFKRQVAYCLLPNGTCTDMVLQVGGRYRDVTAFDFMARMGIWLENFGLPAVIAECLLQSYTGVLRLFPNWPPGQRAAFRTLRAVGAFLVSAAFDGEAVAWVEVVSEQGAPLRLHNPWPGGARLVRASGEALLTGAVLETPTAPGERLRLTPAAR